VAAFRCRYHGAALLLASATPSLESYYRAKRGDYHLFELSERFTGSVLPDVTILDMNDEPGAPTRAAEQCAGG
jgi:primosomal protein N' (replication factor Y)